MSDNGPWPSVTLHKETPCGVVNVIIKERGGKTDFTTHIAKPGGCVRANSTAAWQLAELAIRNGATLKEVALVMAGHACHLSSQMVPSCIAAISEILREYDGVRAGIQEKKPS